MISPNTLIVQTAIVALKESHNVTVVIQDVDILFLLTALTASDKNIYFYKPGQEKAVTQVFPSPNCGKRVSNILYYLLIHYLAVTQHHLVTGRGKLLTAKC